MEGKYPEHDKVRAVKDRSQAVGEFVEWLGENDLHICERSEEKYDNVFNPTTKRVTALLASFFGIDEDKLEAEKRAMLDELRKMNEANV